MLVYPFINNALSPDFKKRFSGYEVRQTRGLNSMVKAVFDGKSLDRVELISNWDNRPLRVGQLQFAGETFFSTYYRSAKFLELRSSHFVSFDACSQ